MRLFCVITAISISFVNQSSRSAWLIKHSIPSPTQSKLVQRRWAIQKQLLA